MNFLWTARNPPSRRSGNESGFLAIRKQKYCSRVYSKMAQKANRMILNFGFGVRMAGIGLRSSHMSLKDSPLDLTQTPQALQSMYRLGMLLQWDVFIMVQYLEQRSSTAFMIRRLKNFCSSLSFGLSVYCLLFLLSAIYENSISDTIQCSWRTRNSSWFPTTIGTGTTGRTTSIDGRGNSRGRNRALQEASSKYALYVIFHVEWSLGRNLQSGTLHRFGAGCETHLPSYLSSGRRAREIEEENVQCACRV